MKSSPRPNIKKSGLSLSKEESNNRKKSSVCTYSVAGMHCASCELLTEKTLLENKNIKAVKSSVLKASIEIEYEGDAPSPTQLNKLFKADGYTFSNKSKQKIESIKKKKEGQIKGSNLSNFFIISGSSLALIIIFYALNSSGLSAAVNVNANSALPLFLLFGLLAGVSSCAALVGGVILSMSRQWSDIYNKDDSRMKKAEPHLMFNAGRLLAYTIFGALLGSIGSVFKLSMTFSSILITLVSVLMILLALQMLGLKYFRNFQISAPKFITRYIVNEKNFSGRYMPFSMGALTFFLPCGFTITAQTLALASGSFKQGALIMLLFALGTLPILLFIGFSSLKFSNKPSSAAKFMKVAGVLVLFFALYNINAQLNVLGFKSLSDIEFKKTEKVLAVHDDLPLIVNGKQVLKMEARSSGYVPNRLKVRVGVPVSWEISDKGSSGCTNAVIAKGLFTGEIKLSPGKTSIKEFTVYKPGLYKFSCWMGMVSGVIEAV